MSTFPQSRQEADAILKQLLAERTGKERNQFQIRSLENTLKVLSETLYSKSTHFIAELIQNADDNTFLKSPPTLEFDLFQREGSLFLLVECNEEGFTKEQVNAICSIGGSTKKQPANGKRAYTGEKGIGFKCVFKVADIVHIHSGHFEFQLDRRRELGMLMPHPSPFPNFVQKKDCTQMLLHLRGPQEYREVLQSLKELKPELLLFLRKLERLAITTPDVLREFTTSAHNEQPTINYDTRTLTIREDSETKQQRFFLVRHEVGNLPETEGREKVTSTEVVLGFPIGDQHQRFHSQNTYAFLPVGNYGLRFIIQADFLLVANRKALQEDLPWNVALRNAIPEAFVAAVTHFNSLPQASTLRYLWPRFLQYTKTGNTFWDQVTTEIVRLLKGKEILQSRSGILRAPQELMFVPEQYRHGTSPLIDLVSCKDNHLSFFYDTNGAPPVLLGIFDVSQMSPARLRQDLEEFATGSSRLCDGRRFADMDSDWRDLIAVAFRKDRSKMKNPLSRIPLVPTQTDHGVEWVAVSDRVFFPTNDLRREDLPLDLHFQIIDKNSCQGDWEELIRFLGVQDLDAAQLCSMILDFHREPHKRKFVNWTRDVIFLFKHRQHLSEDDLNSSLWLLHGGKRYRGDTLYITHPARPCGLLSRASSRDDSPIRIADVTQYTSGFKEDQVRDFCHWLIQDLGVATKPRLVRDGAVTEDWTYLAQHFTSDLLVYLRDNETVVEQQAAVKQALSTILVPLKDHNGLSIKLRDACLPTAILSDICPDLNFVDLPEPDHKDSSPVRYQTRIRAAFNDPLIFLPGGSVSWVSAKKLVWDRPACITHLTALPDGYRDFPKLFKDYASVRTLTVRDVLIETDAMTERSTTDVSKAKELLFALSNVLKDSPILDEETRDLVLNTQLVPAAGLDGANLCSLINCYLPDDPMLGKYFSGSPLVTIADLDLTEISKLSDLIQALGLQERYISTATKCRTFAEGAEPKEFETAKVRTRAKWICKLSSNPTPEMVRFVMETKVWKAKKVSVKYLLDDAASEQTAVSYRVNHDEDHINVYLSPDKLTDDERIYMEHDLASVLAKACTVKNPKCAQLIPTLLRMPLDKISEFLDRQGIEDINRESFELVDRWIEAPEEPVVSGAGDRDEAPKQEADDDFGHAGGDNEMPDPPSPHAEPDLQPTPEVDAGHESGNDSDTASWLPPPSSPSCGSSSPRTVSQGNMFPGPQLPNPFPRASPAPGLSDRRKRPPMPEINTSAPAPKRRCTQSVGNSSNYRPATAEGEGNGESNQESHDSPAPARQEPRISVARATPEPPSFGPHPDPAYYNRSPGSGQSTLDRKGESLVNDLFSKHVEGWNTDEHWTGRLQNRPIGDENLAHSPACFTFEDPGNLGCLGMAECLRIHGVENERLELLKDRKVTYHIDVKATKGEHDTMYLSRSQAAMAIKHRLRTAAEEGVEGDEGKYVPPDNVYILMRVYNLEEPEPEVQILFDPRTAVHKGEFQWQPEIVAVTPVKKDRYWDAMAGEDH